MNEFHSESVFISPICESNKVNLGSQLTQSSIQYCTVTFHTHLKKKPFYLILSYYKSDIFNIYLKFLENISQAAINFKTTVSQRKWDTYVVHYNTKPESVFSKVQSTSLF